MSEKKTDRVFLRHIHYDSKQIAVALDKAEKIVLEAEKSAADANFEDGAIKEAMLETAKTAASAYKLVFVKLLNGI